MTKTLAQFFIFTILVCSQAHARLFLDVSITNKKGIDKGLTLGSELHSIEEVSRLEAITLRMKSGIAVVLNASFIDVTALKNTEVNNYYGPSPSIKVTGNILDSQNNILKDFSENPIIIPLDETSKIVHSKDSQLVEIVIRPHLK